MAVNLSGNFSIAPNATFTWNAVPPSEGITPLYRVTTTANGVASSQIVSTTSYTFEAAGDVAVSVSVEAVNPNDPSQASSPTAATPVKYLLTADGDFDGDGQPNAADADPLVASDLPRIAVASVGTALLEGNSTTVTHGFSAEPGKVFNLQFTGELSQPWGTVPDVSTGNGSFSVDFSKPGDHRQDWNGSMFFRAVR